MLCGEIEDKELAPMDLYSRVKLRASNGDRRNINSRNGLGNAESANAKFSESSCIESKGVQISAFTTAAARKEINLAIKQWDGFMCLLEIAESECSSEIIKDKKYKGNKADDLSAEGTAIEMLGELSKGGHSSRFAVGDLVWGRILSHPWWPGQIYDESKASLLVMLQKKKGCLLVAFFGDDTFGWLDPKDILLFEPHLVEKSKQSNDDVFLKAVEEGVLLVKKRSALGLTCKCRSAFKPTKDKGLFDVDVAGFGCGHVYSVDEIEKAKNGFEPREMLSFLQKLAVVKPLMDMDKSARGMSEVGRAIAYRKAVFEEFDEPYAEAFGISAKRNTIKATGSSDESKKDAKGKQVERTASKVQPQSSSSSVNARQKRSREDAVPWYREFEAEDPVAADKKRNV